MLTKRERAASLYQEAISLSRGRVMGVESMVDVTAERLTNVRGAVRVIEAARGTGRYSLREPDDARLEQMLREVAAIEETLQGDCARWEAR